MTSHDRGHYSGKHPQEKRVDPVIAKAITEHAVQDTADKTITCAAAFKAADACGAAPGEAGFTADKLEIRIIECQMGIFGYKPDKKVVKPMDIVPGALEKAIKDKLDKDKRLSCSFAWEIV